MMRLRHLYHVLPLLLAVAGWPAAASPAPEYELKSAFIYNFATFIDWPARVGKSLTLCVAVPPDALKYFESLQGKPVGNMTLAVRHLGAGESAEGCQILFVADAESSGFDNWLSDAEDQPVLTVAESEEWLKKGVIVDLLLQEKRVVFDVNVEAARGGGIVIDSKLLRLARKIYGLEPPDDPSQKATD